LCRLKKLHHTLVGAVIHRVRIDLSLSIWFSSNSGSIEATTVIGVTLKPSALLFYATSRR
jgi:hypothetical protein